MKQNNNQNEDYWMSVSDLMAGLMLLFLLIVLVKMKNISEKTKEFNYLLNQTKEYKDLERQELIEYELIKIKVTDFIRSNEQLYTDLRNEFKYDLPIWGARLDRDTLSIVFNAPEVLFKQGSSELTERYKNILQDFFPRYLRVLTNHTDIIDKVRIEGHTSSEWGTNTSKETAYFNNMRLSQDRTRSVLKYSMTLPKTKPYWQWAKTKYYRQWFIV